MKTLFDITPKTPEIKQTDHDEKILKSFAYYRDIKVILRAAQKKGIDVSKEFDEIKGRHYQITEGEFERVKGLYL